MPKLKISNSPKIQSENKQPLIYDNVEVLNISEKDYFKIDAISRSDMKRFIEHPVNYKYHEDEDKPAFHFGSAFEIMLFKPNSFADEVSVLPDSVNRPSTGLQERLAAELKYESDVSLAVERAGYKRPPTKAVIESTLRYSDFARRSGSKPVITSEERQRMIRMAEEANMNPLVYKIITESKQQVVYVGTHRDTGLRVKGMVDLLWNDNIIDLKTTKYTLDDPRSIVDKWGYNLQLAHYCALAGVEKNGIIFCQKEAPFEVSTVRLMAEEIRSQQILICNTLIDMCESKNRYDYEQRASHGRWITI